MRLSNQRKGIALVAAVMLIVFASIAVLGVVVFIAQRFQQYSVEEVFTKTIYLAQAGINYSVYQYRANSQIFSGQVNVDADKYFVVSTTGTGGEGESLIVDARAADLANKNKDIVNDTVTNSSGSAVTINQITITWQKQPKTLTGVVINAVSVWAGSIATPPAVLPISDFTIPASTTYPITRVRFDSSVAGDKGVTISFRLTDGTITVPCTIYPAQGSTCQGSGNLTIKSMGKTGGSGIYRTIQANYNVGLGSITDCSEIDESVP